MGPVCSLFRPPGVFERPLGVGEVRVQSKRGFGEILEPSRVGQVMENFALLFFVVEIKAEAVVAKLLKSLVEVKDFPESTKFIGHSELFL